MSKNILETSMYIEHMKKFRSLALFYERRAEQHLLDESKAEELRKLRYGEDTLNAISYKIAESETALSEYKVRNLQILNECRKSLYEVCMRFESVVSNYVDVPISEIMTYQKRFNDLDDVLRYHLTRKLCFSVDHTRLAFGENTKWKWAFTDLQGRATIIGKNLLNYRRVSAGMQPEKLHYRECYNHLKLVLDRLEHMSDTLLSKFELLGRQLNDIQSAIQYLNATLQLTHLTGDKELSDTLRRKLANWKQRLRDVSYDR